MLGKWLADGDVDQFVLAITSPDNQPIERFVFQMGSVLGGHQHLHMAQDCTG